jgi:hypothetical protein
MSPNPFKHRNCSPSLFPALIRQTGIRRKVLYMGGETTIVRPGEGDTRNSWMKDHLAVRYPRRDRQGACICAPPHFCFSKRGTSFGFIARCIMALRRGHWALLTRGPSFSSMPEEERSRPRMFYLSMDFLLRTWPLSWKGTYRRTVSLYL